MTLISKETEVEGWRYLADWELFPPLALSTYPGAVPPPVLSPIPPIISMQNQFKLRSKVVAYREWYSRHYAAHVYEVYNMAGTVQLNSFNSIINDQVLTDIAVAVQDTYGHQDIASTYTKNGVVIYDDLPANQLSTFVAIDIVVTTTRYGSFRVIDNYVPLVYSLYSKVDNEYSYDLLETRYGSYPVANKPNYYSLVEPYYYLDSRTLAPAPTVTAARTEIVKIAYYQNNLHENISNLKSIEWREYTIKFIKDKVYDLPIANIVLGTLYCSSQIHDLLLALPTIPGKYSYSDYFPNAIASLMNSWNSLYNIELANQSAVISNLVGLVEVTKNIITQMFETDRVLRRLSANNNYWNKTPRLELASDLNLSSSHPMFEVDNQRTYDWHIKPVANGIGTLIMDSPRTIEMHKALDAAKYAIDPSTGGERIANLGWYINRQSEVLGIRVKPDGTIDEALEKTINRRLHVEGSTENDPQEFNPNCFGSGGLLVRHVPNKFSPNGTVAGGYRKVKDIPQLLAELHEQANAAMGYQEGTAIEIQLDGQTYRYPNQLALLTELFVTAKQTATYSKGAFFSSLVGEQSIKEVMAGLGLRTVDKFLEFNVAGKTAKLYYKGISASQSIRRKLSAVTTNIGIAIGNII
jgi:hypothetical protein